MNKRPRRQLGMFDQTHADLPLFSGALVAAKNDGAFTPALASQSPGEQLSLPEAQTHPQEDTDN